MCKACCEHRRIFSTLTLLVFLLLMLGTSSFVEAKALLLYKGSEQGYGYNILMKYFAPVLKELIETYDVLDVESIDFPSMDLTPYNLIVTCYYSPQMVNAKRYLEKLTYFVVNGGKILIVNNLGASIDASGTNHPGLAEINSLYNLLGISYTFSWKKVTPLKVIVDNNYSAVSSLKFEKLRDVERYKLISPYSKSLIQVLAEDGNTYDMAILSNLGAIISYSYLFDDDGKLTIDLPHLLATLIYGSDGSFRVLVVGKENYELQKALDYTLLDYDWKSSIVPVLSSYDLVILYNWEFPITDAKLLKYIMDGGTVAVIGKGNTQKQIDSLTLDKELFPTPPDFYISFARNVSFQIPPSGATLLVTSSQGGGLVWKIVSGLGQIIYYPIDLVRKELRGLLIQSVLSQVPFSIQPIVNSWSMHLDDFPLPAYNRKLDILTREFGDITDNDFYYNIWWPSMKQLAAELGIKYTTFFVANYNAAITWPFSFQEYANTPQQLLALKELINSNFEIGIHGYNHIPLTSERWKAEQLDLALSIFKIFLKNTLGETYVPYAYVAPDNIIDAFGVERLLKTFPSLKIVGTTYRGSGTLSEFEILFDKVVVVPRTTYGYYPKEKLIANSVLSLMMLGTYQYFLHPDDLFSNDRNPEKKTWADMYESLRSFLLTMKQYYPFLRNQWASESGDTIYIFFKERPLIKKQQGRLTVVLPIGYHLPRYYYFRSSEPFVLTGGKIVYSYGNLTIIEQIENIMEVRKQVK
ncbi:hypothetical protein SAMN04488510_11740 [Fervidobacterium changbaicum]|uniref:DUF2194 domain-containing protein n=1 Tax=Fervidobacterium changbaicum TaxID=310769 RepID=A0ABX5QQ21_9BACT|nr:DUF2194 domain-containing protein [Fervidobacterium changbaicum]QAV32534.1 DUF2194 domain-containing protein [Fervidobacterium changbaicum]SDH51582.1 hypothetical protein SAMN04488510_11740 [Fervidobacterium changbaicum]